jgi:hypothetical protein
MQTWRFCKRHMTGSLFVNSRTVVQQPAGAAPKPFAGHGAAIRDARSSAHSCTCDFSTKWMMRRRTYPSVLNIWAGCLWWTRLCEFSRLRFAVRALCKKALPCQWQQSNRHHRGSRNCYNMHHTFVLALMQQHSTKRRQLRASTVCSRVLQPQSTTAEAVVTYADRVT